MIYKIQLTEQAKRDLRGIYEYYAFIRFEPRLAKKINRNLPEAIVHFI